MGEERTVRVEYLPQEPNRINLTLNLYNRSCIDSDKIFNYVSAHNDVLLWTAARDFSSLVSYFPRVQFAFSFREGDLRVIRPLVYVREKELRRFAEKVTTDTCNKVSILRNAWRGILYFWASLALLLMRSSDNSLYSYQPHRMIRTFSLY